MWTRDFCRPGWCLIPLPQINFTSRTVLAEFYGAHSPSYRIEITRVSQVGQIDPHVMIDMKQIAPNCPVTQNIVYWSQIVAIEKTYLPIDFGVTQSVRAYC
jgi:hypothetical protein